MSSWYKVFLPSQVNPCPLSFYIHFYIYYNSLFVCFCIKIFLPFIIKISFTFEKRILCLPCILVFIPLYTNVHSLDKFTWIFIFQEAIKAKSLFLIYISLKIIFPKPEIFYLWWNTRVNKWYSENNSCISHIKQHLNLISEDKIVLFFVESYGASLKKYALVLKIKFYPRKALAEGFFSFNFDP